MSKTIMRKDGDQTVIVTTRALPAPTMPDLQERFEKNLAAVRKHRKKWPVPVDATLVLNMHFRVHNHKRGEYHADATVEIPVEGGCDFFSICRTDATYESALLFVIREIENSKWFSAFKAKGVYFRVTGCRMEDLYRGFL